MKNLLYTFTSWSSVLECKITHAADSVGDYALDDTDLVIGKTDLKWTNCIKFWGLYSLFVDALLFSKLGDSNALDVWLR